MINVSGGIVALLLGAFGWLTLEFVGRPLRQFFDLRRQVHSQILARPTMVGREFGHISVGEFAVEELPADVVEGSRVVLDLAAQLTAFSAGEPAANLILRWLGWDVAGAGTAGMRYASAMKDRDSEIEQYRADVFAALRISGDDPD